MRYQAPLFLSNIEILIEFLLNKKNANFQFILKYMYRIEYEQNFTKEKSNKNVGYG